MSTQEIFNYIRVDDRLITGGQPTADQLRSVANEGFSTVINLATFDSNRSLADESTIVHSLGMDYVHIPVVWEHPTQSDFEKFEEAMNELKGAKVFVHCAANFRVTAFYSLYAQKNLGWDQVQAEAFRRQVWKDSQYPVWEAYIAQMRAGFSQQAATPE